MNEKKKSSFFGKLFAFGKKDENCDKDEVLNTEKADGEVSTQTTQVSGGDTFTQSEVKPAEFFDENDSVILSADFKTEEKEESAEAVETTSFDCTETEANGGKDDESVKSETDETEKKPDFAETVTLDGEAIKDGGEIITLAGDTVNEGSEPIKDGETIKADSETVTPEIFDEPVIKKNEQAEEETEQKTLETDYEKSGDSEDYSSDITSQEQPTFPVPETDGETVKADGKENADGKEIKADDIRTGLDMFGTAKVFGVSEERLETEFKLYKVDKVAKKTELMLCDQYISAQETAARIKAAVSAKLFSVTVLPNRLKCAIDAAERKIPVSVAVCYPLGADDFVTRKYAVKKAAVTAASGIEIPFDPTAERGVNYKIMLKEYKKIVRAAKKKPVTVILEAASYTDTELIKIVSVLKEAGVKRIKSSAGNKNAVTCAYADKNLAEAAQGKLTVVCCAKDYTPEGLVKAFSYGADFVSSKNAVEAINGLRTLLIGKE